MHQMPSTCGCNRFSLVQVNDKKSLQQNNIYIVEMPWGGTWKSSIAAFLFLFPLLGVILTQNTLDASLASLSNFCKAILIMTYRDTKRFTFETSENNDSYYITKICSILNILLII